MPSSPSPNTPQQSKPAVPPSNPVVAAAPHVPTMTNASVIPPVEDLPLPRLGALADELSDDIEAKPLGGPDFAQDIKPFLKNPALSPRWIFTDRRRYAQARSQGWRNATIADLKPGYAHITPFAAEGGTKIINGDLILMLIDRKIYLGALRYKHQVASALSDAAVQRKISAQKGQAAMGPVINAVNQQFVQAGKRPALEMFAPDETDVATPGVLSNPNIAAKEIGRIGEAPRDTGLLADMAREAGNHE